MMSSQMGRAAKGYLKLRLGIGSALMLGALAVLLAWSSPAAALTLPVGGSQSQPTIAAGEMHSLAVKADGSVWLWGYHGGAAAPVRLGIDNDWSAVAAGGFSDWAMLKAEGSLWSCGIRTGVDYDTATFSDTQIPIRVGSDIGWSAVSAGELDCMAIRADGSLWCVTSDWGSEPNPSLEDDPSGAVKPRYLATRIGTDNDWAAVDTGSVYSLALKSDGSLWVLEYVTAEDSGDEAPTAFSTTRTGTETDWAAVSAGFPFSVALKADGSLWSILPDAVTRIGTDSDWVAVEVGLGYSLALKADGTLWAWGENSAGQLGDGTVVDRDLPVRVGTSNKWRAISAGYFHSLALRSDGTLWAWGSNGAGQLGDGTMIDRQAPVQVLTGVRVPQWSADGGSSVSFSDVAGSPYEAAIHDLVARGAITGFEDGTFRPDAPVTRQQFAKMIVKAMLYPVTGSEVCPFNDVAAQVGTDPLYPSKYVAVCAQQGITHGATATTFNPENTITHEQLITMVVRAAALPDPPGGYAPDFTSSQFSLEEHYGNARRAAYSGILDGLVGVGPSYDFGAACTRGECAQLLHNLLELL